MKPAGDALAVTGLVVAYRAQSGWSSVVEDVSFTLGEGEILGLAGESGCGKSTVAYAVMGERRAGSRILAGRVGFEGHDILTLSDRRLQRLRGTGISLVPQNPTTSLTPTMTCGSQVSELLEYHGLAHGAAARKRTLDLLTEVGLPDPEAAFARYPHQMSGGQQQRVVIAMAIAGEPRVVVLDEPTTGLDVTTQWRILQLLRDLRDRLGTAMLYVSHDLAALSQLCDRIAVMYAGRIVEIAPAAPLFARPRHPYTQALLAAIPRLDVPPPADPPLQGGLRRDRLPPGCPFAPRCGAVLPACVVSPQALAPVEENHEVACWRWRDLATRPASWRPEPEEVALAR